ncbi:MAG: hypothetical protein MUE44_08075 [Oscillatoriaceae cyanobacterium Prado104]|jgi:hypothetical protein|nr:hypothetical protein [Oscillatoriaceae cyanobacterium Prado104]
MNLTAALASKLIRQILEDYNYWPGSEGDSPLKVSRSKTLADNTLILARDASLRRAAIRAANPAATGYKIPDRVVEPCTLAACFGPRIVEAKAELDAASAGLSATNLAPVAGMEMAAEKLEFLTQLHNAFGLLANPRCYIVSDVPPPPPTIVLSQSGNRVTAKIENMQPGMVVRFCYDNMGQMEMIGEDDKSPFTANLSKAGTVKADVMALVGGVATSIANASIVATYTPPATPPTNPPAPPVTIAPTPGPAFVFDAYTGFFIVGESNDGESVIAGTLLIQT